MKALAIIDAEIAWWDAKSKAMKRPAEALALACSIGAVSALTNVRTAIAMEAASAGETEGLDGNRDSAGLKGIAQPSGLTKGDTDHDDR